MITFFGCFICLLMPVVSYEIYNRDYLLSRIFGGYMRVPADEYFGFALPAMAGFTLAITWPLKAKYPGGASTFYKDKFIAITRKLANMPKAGIQIVVIGCLMLYISAVLPDSLKFFAYLFYFSSFAGLLYVYFGPKIAYKPIILVIMALFTIGNAIQTGIFTVLVYMSATLFSFFFVGNRTSFIKKLFLFLAAIFLVVVIQSVKNSFRKATWMGNYEGSKVTLFQDLVTKQVGSDQFLGKKMFFTLYMRSNQGVNVSRVMNRIPSHQPFDNGTYLFESIASAFVPRFLWPDKPQAGGVFNMQHYAGVQIRSYSTNVGPLGEAYGNFGVNGGIIYIFLLGALLRIIYKKVLNISENLPVIILWIPVLFYQVTYSAESDSLQILNSLIKSAFFLWLLYKLLPAWFGVTKKKVMVLNEEKVSDEQSA